MNNSTLNANIVTHPFNNVQNNKTSTVLPPSNFYSSKIKLNGIVHSSRPKLTPEKREAIVERIKIDQGQKKSIIEIVNECKSINYKAGKDAISGQGVYETKEDLNRCAPEGKHRYGSCGILSRIFTSNCKTATQEEDAFPCSPHSFLLGMYNALSKPRDVLCAPEVDTYYKLSAAYNGNECKKTKNNDIICNNKKGDMIG